MLADYMRIILLHKFLDNSTKHMLQIFNTHTCFTPPLESLETTETDVALGKPRPEGVPKDPLLLLNLIIKPEQLSLDPSLAITKTIFTQLINLWYENCLSMKSFVADPIFKPFTK